MNDRRKPLGGVDKSTFVHSFGDARLNAEFTYDLISGLRSDICFKMDSIKEAMAKEKKQCFECQQQFVKKMKLKNNFLPISKIAFYAICAIILISIGAGIIGPMEIVKLIKPFL